MSELEKPQGRHAGAFVRAGLYFALLAQLNFASEVWASQTLIVEDSVVQGLHVDAGSDPGQSRIELEGLLNALDYWLYPADLEWLKVQSEDGMVRLSLLRALGLDLLEEPGTGKIQVKVPESVRIRRVSKGNTNYDELFEQVFNKKKPALAEVRATLVVEDKRLSSLRIKLSPAIGRIQVEAAPILAQLAKWITSDRLKKVSDQQRDGMLKFESIWHAGVLARYDDALLQVVINVPVEYQSMQVKSLSGLEEDYESAPALGPSLLSGFVNATASDQLQVGSMDGTYFSANNFNSSFEGALNLATLVFEGQAFYSQLDPVQWRRGDARIVKDIPALTLRLSAGDINHAGFTYERAIPLGGIRVATEFGTRPTVLVTALSNQEIELKLPSTVNIYRNGVLLQALTLKPGKYDLRDLPLLSGENELQVEVIDASGRKEVINLSQFYNSTFLAPGVSQLSYSAGYPWRQDGTHRLYNRARPTYMLSHRIGIFNELTAAAFYQHDYAQSVMGGSVLLPAFWGTFQLEAAKSNGASDGISAPGGYAYRGFYSYTGGNFMRSFGLGVERRTSGFTFFGDGSAVQPLEWDFYGTLTRQLSSSVSASLLGGYGLTRSNNLSDPATMRSYRTSLGLNRAFDRGTSGSLTLGYINRPALIEVSGAVYLNWTFPEKQQTLRAAYDTSSDRTLLGWYKNANSTVGSTRSYVTVQRDPGGREVAGALTYIGNRGEMTLDQRFRDSAVTSDTRLTASTAFVFAGAHAGFGRRVGDSFALIQPGRAQRGADIRVNPLSDGSYFAESDLLGGPVLPTLGSYFRNRVYLDSPESANLPNSIFSVKPTYKSGVLISLDTEYDVVLRARLVSPAGKPLPRIAGELVELAPDHENTPAIPFFTNRAGLFQAEGLRAGEYEVRLFDDAWKSLSITISSDAVGVTDLGQLLVTPAANKIEGFQ